MDSDREFKKVWEHIECIEQQLDESIASVLKTLEQVRSGMVGSLDGTNEGLLNRVKNLEVLAKAIQVEQKLLRKRSDDTEKKKYLLIAALTALLWVFGKGVDWWITKK